MRETPVRPRWGRSPEEETGNPLQYSCLENSMDRGAWWATVHGIAKSRTELTTWLTVLWGNWSWFSSLGSFVTTPASFFASNLSIFYTAAELEYLQLPEDTMLSYVCAPGMIS